MGQQIIKQPDGTYAIWSTVVDDFIIVGATPQEIAEEWISQQVDEIRKRVAEAVAKLDAGEKPYYQFTKSFDECVAIVRELHGDGAESLKLLGVTTCRK